jgi:hypothetical protein
MMSYDEWLPRIIDAARDIASREFQEEAWFPGGKVVSSPDEAYQVLIEDFTIDLFFETYGQRFSPHQLRTADEFRSILQDYYDKLARHPDPRLVIDDPNWNSVRQAADRFVRAFRDRHGQSSENGTGGTETRGL